MHKRLVLDCYFLQVLLARKSTDEHKKASLKGFCQSRLCIWMIISKVHSIHPSGRTRVPKLMSRIHKPFSDPRPIYISNSNSSRPCIYSANDINILALRTLRHACPTKKS